MTLQEMFTMKYSRNRVRDISIMLLFMSPVLVLFAYLGASFIHNLKTRFQFAGCLRANMEIKAIELGLVKVLTDAGAKDFRELLADLEPLDAGSDTETLAKHTSAAYELLTNGKKAKLNLKADYRRRLGDEYMELRNDPWGRKYVVYFPGLGKQKNSALQIKLAAKYTELKPGEPAEWKRQPPEHFYVFSLGKDGILQALSGDTAFGPTGAPLQYGDDVSNMHWFDIGWAEDY